MRSAGTLPGSANSTPLVRFVLPPAGMVPLTSFLRWRARLTALGVLACGCTRALDAPTRVAAPPAVFFEVPYPPPAAFAELVPPQPARNAVWIDGGWLWLGKQYAWDRGGWLVPEQGAGFASWSVRYEADGRLMFAPSAWFKSNGAPLGAPPFIVSASIPNNEVTSETQSPR